ncbi:bifunctional diguanylate cyclase/phosphodiesterase [Paenibacillus physcomitrellae]|uniref:Signaling protein n=1 Tax=Paenibacillus physcomitrellae TaxID=1619311 RepID=A0ABQ1GF56_9BACL|nr:EAL domain-containing protein [Paenibacillus physcomitrellae]GGA42365.1 putative signaling protein [Paenibacillus physcomitrellae]
MVEPHFFVGTSGWTILLSIVTMVLASYSGLHMASKVTSLSGRLKVIWLLFGSFVMGSGIWVMHMIGLLELYLQTGIPFDPLITLFSFLFTLAAAAAAFSIIFSGKPKAWKLGAAGIVLGVGIVGVHYIGMSAMPEEVYMSYDSSFLLLSILFAVVVTYGALFLFNRFQSSPFFNYWRLSGALTMGAAICGMHYMGMIGAHIMSKGYSINLGMHHNNEIVIGGPGRMQLSLLIPLMLVMACVLAVSWSVVYVDRKGLKRLAFSDSLTGFSNRHGLPNFFKHHFRPGTSGTVLFLDLDRFKMVNDTLGHDAGDRLLQIVADRIQKELGKNQVVFRLGGDEFLIACTHSSEEEVCQLAERLLRAIKEPFYLKGSTLRVTGSIGISLSSREGHERERLMQAADAAMYFSKVAGKNRYTVYTNELNQKRHRRMGLEKDLEAAIELEQFFVVYQPKWDSVRGGLQGMEALIRWEHPDFGVVSPGEFIPIAEETGVIVPMTEWLMAEVACQTKKWAALGFPPFPVSVNMSAVLFTNGQVADMVERCLMESGMVPSLLELEITETVAMSDLDSAVVQLNRIKALGVCVSLDDFGTGYSSLGALDEMPIDTVKIDQIFIRKYTQPSKQAMISSIIAIAQHLGLQVVAEGVETEEQVRFLKSHGCKVMQGYYFGKPMRAVDCTAWLRQLPERAGQDQAGGSFHIEA